MGQQRLETAGRTAVCTHRIAKSTSGATLDLPKAAEGNKALITAASEAVKSTSGTFSEFAQTDEGRKALALALLGTEEPAPQDVPAFNALLRRIIQGQIKPALEVGTFENPAIAAGHLASSNGAGTIFVSDQVSQDDVIGAIAEEFGHAIANAAEQLGLPVKPGDAGFRIAAAKNGQELTASMYEADEKDTVSMTFQGQRFDVDASNPLFVKGRDWVGTIQADRQDTNTAGINYLFGPGNDTARVIPGTTDGIIVGGPGNDVLVLQNMKRHEVYVSKDGQFLRIRFRDSRNGNLLPGTVIVKDFESVIYGATGEKVSINDFRRTGQKTYNSVKHKTDELANAFK